MTTKKIENQVKLKLHELVYDQLKYGIAVEAIVFTIVLVVLWPAVNKSLLLSWYCVVELFCLLRLIGTTLHHHDKNEMLHLKYWARLFALYAFIAGISWGFLGSFLMPVHPIQQMFCIIMLVGAVTAANLFYSPMKHVYEIFLVFAFTPQIGWFFSRSGVYLGLGVAAVIYFALMMVLSKFTNKLITHSISLQYENQSLVEGLSSAKVQLEYLNDKLAIEATHDPLTNLLNRKSMDINLVHMLKATRNKNGKLAILFCDLDHFKAINDKYGHDTGDRLLIVISQRLKSVLTLSDVIARLGGDEFIIVLNDIKSVDGVTKVIENIMRAVHQDFYIDNIKYNIGISIGVSIFPLDAQDDKSLLKCADNALYKAKSAGRNCYELSSSSS